MKLTPTEAIYDIIKIYLICLVNYFKYKEGESLYYQINMFCLSITPVKLLGIKLYCIIIVTIYIIMIRRLQWEVIAGTTGLRGAAED